jgi:hypothetical protein
MVKKEFIKVISHSGDDRLRLKIEMEKSKVVDIVVAQPELVWSVFIIFQIIRDIFQIEL